jgi:uncharacterized protein
MSGAPRWRSDAKYVLRGADNVLLLASKDTGLRVGYTGDSADTCMRGWRAEPITDQHRKTDHCHIFLCPASCCSTAQIGKFGYQKQLQKAMDKHDILHEFPEFKEKIHELKVSDHHFRKLFDEYHELDHQVRRIETGVEATTDEHLTELRKHRVHLKDSIYAMLTKA